MEDVVVYAFYAWLIISVIAFVVQLVRRVRFNQQRKQRQEERARQMAAGEIPDDTAGAEPSSSPPASPSTEPSASPPPPVAASSPATDAPAENTSSTRLDTVAEIPADQEPAPGALPDAVSAPAVPARMLGDLLADVELPCQLKPDDDGDLDRAAVTLITEAAPAPVVGAALADELERVGYEIFSLAENEAVAKRNDSDVVSMRIDTETLDVGPNPVMVDMWVGGGPKPT